MLADFRSKGHLTSYEAVPLQDVMFEVSYRERGETPWAKGDAVRERVPSSVQFRDTDGAELGRTFAKAGVSTSRSVTRDVQGRVSAVTVPGLGARSTGYDASGKITSQTGFGFTGSGTTYGYGESGQKTSENLSLAYPGASYANSYEYTAAGRLATASVDGTTTSYRYDDAGNLDLVTKGGVDTTLTYDQASRRLMAMGTTAFGWDQAQGRRTSMRRSGEASVTYEYTDAGRLARFANPNSSTTASYTYGAQGQRDSSVVTVGSLTTTTTYVYDGLSLLNLAAQRSDGETYSITHSYGEDQRAWAAVYESSDMTAPVIFHPVTTDRGDVVELTDAAGAPFAAYRYDAWGKVLSESSQATGSLTATLAADITARQPLRYAGYCYDAESATYYLSARQYDPATMQFLTKDPARADGEESAYQYCGGDPVGKTDRSGLWAVLWSETIYPGMVNNWNYRLSEARLGGFLYADLYPEIAMALTGGAFQGGKAIAIAKQIFNGGGNLLTGKNGLDAWLGHGQWVFRAYDKLYLERSSHAYPNPDARGRAMNGFHIVKYRWLVKRYNSDRQEQMLLLPRVVWNYHQAYGRTFSLTPSLYRSLISQGRVY